MADSFGMEFEVTAKTAAAQQGFQGIQAITDQIRSDLNAINDATEGLTEKASKMREFWQENLDVLEGMKSILEIVKTTTQINQTALDSNLQRIQEILSSVRGLGGNMGQAMSMLGIAGGQGYGSGNYQGGGGGYSTSPLASQDFSGTTNAYQQYSLQNPMTYVKNPNALMNRMMLRDSNPYAGTVAGFGGGRRNPPPPTANSASYNDDDEYRNMFSDRAEPYNTNQGTLRDQLLQYRHQNSTVPMGDEAHAATYAYKDLMNNINRVAGTGRVGTRLARAAQRALGNSGISPYEIQKAQRNADIRNVPDPVTGQPTSYYERSGGYSDVEKNTLKIADKVAAVFGSNLMKSFTKFNGYAQVASAVYGTAVDVANQVRQVTGFAQEQGQVFGKTDYGRSAGMTGQAFFKSGFNLNPFYSMQDVMQAQMSGGALGLKGAGLSNYVNKAMDFKKNFGLDPQQTQQILGTGLGVGVGVGANAAAFAKVRQIENTTQTSTAYGNQAYLQGMTSYAGMGASGNAAAQLGVTATKFGAGNLQLQAMGATGTEGMGSTLNNALMAQNLGTSYTGLYAAERKSSAGTLAKAQNATQIQILGFAGIDANAGYKGKDDFYNKNADKAMILQQVLSTMQGYQKESASPKAAMIWAWGIVQQKKDLAHPKKGKKSNSMFGNILGFAEKYVTKGLTNVLDAPFSLAGHVVHGVDDAIAIGTGVVTGQSLGEALKGSHKNNEQFDRWLGHPVDTATQGISDLVSQGAKVLRSGAGSGGGASTSAMGGGRQAPQTVNVEIGMHPNLHGQFISAVKTGNQGNQTGGTHPNNQPTRTNF